MPALIVITDADAAIKPREHAAEAANAHSMVTQEWPQYAQPPGRHPNKHSSR